MVIDGIAIFTTAPSGSLWIKDYKVIYLGFPMQRTMLRCLLTRNCCWFVCFPRELWVWEKIHLTFAKKWEIKNLPWDHEKGSETVWHTMKPGELREVWKYHARFEEKLNSVFEKSMRNLANFHQNTWKCQNWDFNGILLSKIKNTWAKKLQRIYV